MTTFNIRNFERNPTIKGKLTSSTAYLYGICARKLWYSVNENREGFTNAEINAMNYGTNKHREIQRTKYNWCMHEKHLTRTIPEINGVKEIGATIDVLDWKCKEGSTGSHQIDLKYNPPYCNTHQFQFQYTKIIEIKPKYSRMAYYQTLVERFVRPKLPIFMYSYVMDKEFPLKADYEMSVVYIGRILTAMMIKPPRVPFAKHNKEPCSKCLFRERCYSETSGDFDPVMLDNKSQWNKYKPLTDDAIIKLQKSDTIWIKKA